MQPTYRADDDCQSPDDSDRIQDFWNRHAGPGAGTTRKKGTPFPASAAGRKCLRQMVTFYDAIGRDRGPAWNCNTSKNPRLPNWNRCSSARPPENRRRSIITLVPVSADWGARPGGSASIASLGFVGLVRVIFVATRPGYSFAGPFAGRLGIRRTVGGIRVGHMCSHVQAMQQIPK